MSDLTDAFALLKKELPGFEDRQQQIEMATEVLECLYKKERLLIEAGTGVGKTFAYLIPSILSGEKTVISTATLALQSQLVKKDLIFLRGILPRKFSFAMLKGKNNYLCIKKEREFQPEFGGTHRQFLTWATETDTGDRDELDFVPEYWHKVSGDSDDCNAGMCAFYDECFYYAHYREACKKDLLVINHHLLVYDFLSDFNLLPFHAQLIVDEAHQLENITSHASGSLLNYKRFMWLLYRLKGLKIVVDHLFEPVEHFFRIKGRLAWNACPIPEEIIDSLKSLRDQCALGKLIDILDSARDSMDEEEAADKLDTTINFIKSLDAAIEDFIEQGNEDKVYYVSQSAKKLELRSSFVDCQSLFKTMLGAYESVVMTSATLAAGGSFAFIKSRMGIEGCNDKIIGSPFDFKKQALLYIAKGLPSPVRETSDEFQTESVSVIEELINASMGRALVLFTSYSHLKYAAENLDCEFPVKSQGDMPPSKLIKWFKDTPNSVLLATASFWQGIDIKGENLSMVIIVKLPFGTPGDPVYDERCRRLGNRWFGELALPSATLTLKQGFGRLIRGRDDFGVCAILDSRVVSSSYGKSIIASLPPMKLAYSAEDVISFFESIASADECV
ncbi:MAG: hypothetical protein ISR96_05140 [Nitrospira sp.]|nr:hypothetical protein [bacterium]MBL7048886.1 hypothetical protein [Nitrospira sp.]